MEGCNSVKAMLTTLLLNSFKLFCSNGKLYIIYLPFIYRRVDSLKTLSCNWMQQTANMC